LIFGES